MSNSSSPVPEIDISLPHSARVWNYWLGGKDNYEADRNAGEAFVAAYPGIRDIARSSRYWLARVVRHLAGEAGVRQFLDVGTGLPTVDNTHEIAQRTAPEAHIVYVDHDPLVLAHARALLTSSPQGATSYVHADVHDPATIMTEAGRRLDLSRPVALMLIGILGHVREYEEARSIVDRLMAALPSGSYLALYDGTDTDPEYVAATDGYNSSGGVPYILRSPEAIAGYFEGLELVEPGVVELSTWRPEPGTAELVTPVAAWGGVGRKP
ncbi:SAM-dependent methyltransferase [Streptomyces sp. 3MP-14]|uniref:SAM-dependent methyltransferase n=1 Tax=Streptomyces mimosae TaxID=2586635 RepID=A0A5N6AES4_9ACTN|nr:MULTISPECIES: SAM-dependent methyltransferase [Streptomyces]KAB8166349.1 SAM-dependent methyltransferase [Streptomyces mimosae]KAB8174142.1 SAM-dependent methyltransferase [Streptomyces sp. 3MP-14]